MKSVLMMPSAVGPGRNLSFRTAGDVTGLELKIPVEVRGRNMERAICPRGRC
jgi:hypothetical protein